MNHRRLFLVLILLGATVGLAMAAEADHLDHTAIVVMTAPGAAVLGTGDFARSAAVTGRADIDALCRRAGVMAVEPYYHGTLRRPGLARLADRLRWLRLAPGADAASLAARLARVAGVQSAELPSRPVPYYTPNDPRFVDQWYLTHVGAPAAWDVIRGPATALATVALLDAGILLSDPDLAPNLWINAPEDIDHDGRFTAADLNGVDDDGNGWIDDVVGYDFTTYDPDPSGTLGHGDGVAACISEATDNGLLGAGLGFSARMMIVKVITDGGSLGDAYMGLLYAADNGAGVINCSWGVPVPHDYEQAIIDAIWAEDVAVVAAGGDQDQLVYPAAYDHVYAVSATDQFDHVASFAPWGDYVDICAPGVNVLTLWNGSLTWVSGTSFATGLVSGLAALLRALHPQASAAAVLQTISDTAVPVTGAPGPVGAGRIDAAAAVAAEATPVVAPPAPGFALGAYPTPFNAATTVSFHLARPGPVDLAAYDAQGARVAVIARGEFTDGDHRVTWDAARLASGPYVLKLVTDGGTDACTVVLVK